MRSRTARVSVSLTVTLLVWSGLSDRNPAVVAQAPQEPGRSIGAITTHGDLVVMTLEEAALGSANLFDLAGRTLRFTPARGGGYHGENLPLQWDAEFGAELSGASAALDRFAFPFSGGRWTEVSIGVTGSISFGSTAGRSAPGGGGGGRGGGGVSIGRFDQLQDAAATLVDTVPAICVFMKPRMDGTRYFKQVQDRAVITWSLTEPAGGIQDFTWTPTVNRFQAALHRDGTIELSYEQIAAQDAIVGIYPVIAGGRLQPLASIADAEEAALPAHLDLKAVTLSAVAGTLLDVSFETRGAVVPEGDPAATGVVYQISFAPSGSNQPGARAVPPLVWTIRGVAAGGRGGGTPRYTSSGRGVGARVRVAGNRISIQGILPVPAGWGARIAVSAEARAGGPGAAAAASGRSDAVTGSVVSLSGLRSPRADLSAIRRQDGPFALIYEPFHYVALPNPRDLTCTVIQALGDRFDFLAYYSDFRIDNQEAGTPSTGPRGGGPDGGEVTGIGAPQRSMESYCTAGRFQWQFVQPVYVGSNQMQMYPPEGAADTNVRNIATYARQLERRPDGRMRPYNYGLSQIAHEMGHRWSAFVSARVAGDAIPLGPTHWARGLHAPAAYPYQRPSEASAMGGGVWQDNLDGTFTQLDDDYYVPATGWSHLELYLMGLSAPSEVPDFFILRNLAPAGRDTDGRPVFKADRTKVTVADVIAAEGPRRPDVDRAQRQFNTGIVVIVEHGRTPSAALIERANGIRDEWIKYFAITTGHRASMTATPRERGPRPVIDRSGGRR